MEIQEIWNGCNSVPKGAREMEELYFLISTLTTKKLQYWPKDSTSISKTELRVEK